MYDLLFSVLHSQHPVLSWILGISWLGPALPSLDRASMSSPGLCYDLALAIDLMNRKGRKGRNACCLIGKGLCVIFRQIGDVGHLCRLRGLR